MTSRLTPEERANIRAGCHDNATHFNGTANVDADTVLKALAYIAELEAQLETIHISYDKKIHLLVMQVDSADWAVAELEAENKTLLNTIAARDQWADQLTEQYAAREVEVKAALEYCNGSMGFINKARYIAELLNITLD